jgi:raffinose/stachyose/melibiose transport system substrate-binding protein
MHRVVRVQTGRVRRPVLFGLTVTAVTALLAGCAAPGSATPPNADTPRSVRTDISTEEAVVDITMDATQVATMKPITDAFTALHRNVTFKITGEDFAALQQNAPKLMASGNVPDLITLPTPGNTIKDRLVANLDEYAAAYGWNKFPASQLDQWRFDNAGVRGRGSLYGIGIGFTLTGVYYNKDLAAQAGISGPPTTMKEFERDLEAAKAAGVTPLLTSGKDGLVFFPYQSLWLGQGTAKTATDWVFGTPNATIDTPEAVAAAQTLQNWAQAGYLASDVTATDSATAQARFTAGKGLFFNSGNWLAAPLGQTMGNKVGFFLFPAAAGKPYAAMSDPANFVIPAKAKHADAAAAFLNFTFSDAGRKLVVEQKGLAPGGPSDATPVPSNIPVVADASRAFQQLNKDNGVVPFMGNATASFFASTLTPQLQLLLIGKVAPMDFAKTLQSDYVSQLRK